MSTHIANQIHNPALRSDSTLNVVGVVSNPVRYHSRYRIAREWIEAMAKTPGVRLHIVETAFGDRHHELEDLCRVLGVSFLGLRTRSEIWAKENTINLGVRDLLPRDWKYMAWVDADVFFRDPNWARETIHQLQHCSVIQPFQDCIDLGHAGTILEKHVSFGSLIARNIRRQKKPNEPYHFGHPGFAWACTRAFWEAVGGLVDCAILGSADHHMACAIVNEVAGSMHDKMSSGFKRKLTEWQRKAHRATDGIMGYVPTLIEHRFHGPKKRRFYRERWQILVDHDYCPDSDLTYDEQGLIQLTGKPKLEQAIRGYNRSRLEDSIEDV
jgi:hypothetical protein